MTRFFRRLAVAICTALALPFTSSATSLTWTNTAGGSWTGITNWSPNQVPVAADTAYVTNAGTYTVTISAGATVSNLVMGLATVGSIGTPTVSITGGTLTAATLSVETNSILNLAGATMTVTNATIKGVWNWTGGNVSGVVTNTVTSSGSLNLSTATAKALLTGTVINGGTATWSGAGISGYFGAQFINNNLLTISSSLNYAYGGSGTGPVLINGANGVINVATGTSLGFNSMYYFNYGAINFTNSSLTLNNCFGTNAGVLNLDTNSFVNFDVGTLTLDGSLICPVGDHFRFRGMTLDLVTTNITTPSIFQSAGTVNQLTNIVVNSYNQSSGSWFIKIPNAALNIYNLTNGDLRGANITITNINWLGGGFNSENAASNTVTVPAGGTLSITTAAAKTLSDYTGVSGRRIINNGTAVWSGAGITGYFGAQFVNNNLLNISNSLNFVWSGNGSGPAFINTGTINEATGVAFGLSSAYFYNSGTVNLDTGSLTFTGCVGTNTGAINLTASSLNFTSFTGINTGSLILDPASFINFDGGTLTLDGAVVCPGAEHLRFRGMTVDLVTTNLTTPSIFQSAGTVNQLTNIVVNSYNQANGSWFIKIPNATLNNYNLTNGDLRGANIVITNISWQGGGFNSENATSNTVTVPSGGTLAIFSASAKSLSDYSGTSGRRIVNNGTATWGGAGITGYFGAQIVNNGVLTITNSLSYVWSGNGSGPFLINNGTINQASGVVFALSSVNYLNNGIFNINNGSLSFNNCAGTNSGLLSLDSTSFVNFDTGTLTLGGSLFSPAADHLRFRGMNVDITTTNIVTPSLFQSGGTVSQYTNITVAAYNQANGTWFLKTAGTAFVNTYNLTNGELRGANLIVTNFNWLGGSLNAENAGSNSISIASGGTLNISSSAAKSMSDYSGSNNGRKLVNNSTATWSGAGITGYYGSQIINNNFFTISNSLNYVYGGSGMGPFLINNNTLTLSDGVALGLTSVNYLNNNSIIITNGSITFTACAGTNGSLLSLDATSYANFDSGTLTLDGPLYCPAPDHFRFRGMNVDLVTTNINTPALYQSGGTVSQLTNVVVSSYDQSSGTWFIKTASTAALKTYNFTNGELRGANIIITNFNWQGGSLNSENSGSNTVTIPAGGTLNITTVAAKAMGDYSGSNSGRKLLNNGSATWNGAGITGYYGSQIVNNNLLNITTSLSYVYGGSGLGPFLINNSTLNVANGVALNLSSVNYLNAGNFNIANGSLTFTSCAGTNTGLLNLDATSFANFDSGALTVDGSLVCPAGDHFRFRGMNVDIVTTNINTSALYQSGGTVSQFTNINVTAYDQASGTWFLKTASPAALNTYNFTNGELRGANITITNFNWQGGSLNSENAGSNTVTIASGGTLNITTVAAKGMGDYSGSNNGRRLVNNGSATWSGAGITGYWGSQLVNNSIFNIASSLSYVYGGSGSGPFLINNQSFTTASGVDFALNTVNYLNNGSISLTNGSLTFTSCAGTNNGVLKLDATSFANLDSGALTLGGSLISPTADHIRFRGMNVDVVTTNITTPALYQSGGTVSQLTNIAVTAYDQASGTWFLKSPNPLLNTYNFTNGELRGANVIITNFNWFGGALNADGPGSNLVTVANSLNISTATAKSLSYYVAPGRTLLNLGSATWSGVGISGSGTATIQNNGSMNLTGDVGLVFAGGTSTVFQNNGTFLKTAGTGVASFSGTFITNTGTMSVTSGGLSVGGNFVQTSGSATLGTNFTCQSNVRIEGGSFAAGGAVTGYFYNNGTTSAGSPLGFFTASSYTNTVASTLKVELGGLTGGTNFDQIRLSGANSLNGKIDISLVNGFTPVAGNLFVIMTHPSRTGIFTITNSPQYDFSILYTTTNVVLRAENAKPALTFSPGTNQFVCTPFILSATANDIDGYVTNIQFQINGLNIATVTNFAGVNPFTAKVKFSYDFPGASTLTAQATDERGGITITNLTAQFTNGPVEVITLGGFVVTNSTFEICMLGQVGTNYTVFANTNLLPTNWVNLGTMENTNGIWRFYDTNSKSFPLRYYRARQGTN